MGVYFGLVTRGVGRVDVEIGNSRPESPADDDCNDDDDDDCCWPTLLSVPLLLLLPPPLPTTLPLDVIDATDDDAADDDDDAGAINDDTSFDASMPSNMAALELVAARFTEKKGCSRTRRRANNAAKRCANSLVACSSANATSLVYRSRPTER